MTAARLAFSYDLNSVIDLVKENLYALLFREQRSVQEPQT